MTRTIALFVHRIARPLQELTGIGRYALELSHQLAARRDLRLVLLSPFEGMAPADAWPDVPIVRVGGNRRVLQARWTLTGRPVVDRLVADLDLVHAVSPVLPVPTQHIPVVTTVHDLFPLDRPRDKSLRGRVMFQAALRRATRDGMIITPSRHVHDQVVQRLGVPADRVTVVAEGVDERFHRARPDVTVRDRLSLPDTGYLLTLGSLTRRKNVVVLLEALARLPADQRPPLVVAGPDGDATAAFDAAVVRHGLDGDVRRVGFLDDRDVPAVLAGAMALAQPSLDEGFGLPVAESLAAGTPVLAAASGSLPEVVGDAGVLLPPDDPAAWARAITDLPAQVGHLADRARQRAAAFTWVRAADETVAVYQRALAGPREGRPCS